MDNLWKIIERTCLALGLPIAGATLYFTAAGYYAQLAGGGTASAPTNLGASTTPPWWIIALCIIGVLLLLTGWTMMFIRKRERLPKSKRHLTNPSFHFPTPDWHEPLVPIVNQTYRNETVQLDGKAFHDCRFENVTFLYNGTKPTSLIGCTLSGAREFTFQTDNPSVMTTHEITNWLRTNAGQRGIIERNLINRDQR